MSVITPSPSLAFGLGENHPVIKFAPNSVQRFATGIIPLPRAFFQMLGDVINYFYYNRTAKLSQYPFEPGPGQQVGGVLK